MDQVYVQPAPKPFSGTGNRLGNVVTPMVHSSPSSSLPSSIPVSFEIDDQQPITTLQIRLADGTRLLAKFNHTHTLRDVRSFVTHSRPDSRRFILQTTFPVKTLDDDNSNLKDSGLLNCTLVQKYI
ncbi:hypothetical protein HMI55_005901 [Coelomomyces lativittatus]|nr:hypothetical protein HMI55_005901 [Coelomomyces lativittatus]